MGQSKMNRSDKPSIHGSLKRHGQLNLLLRAKYFEKHRREREKNEEKIDAFFRRQIL